MRHLIRLIMLRYLRAAPGRSLLTLFGILLGVAVVVAIDVVNASVMASFRDAVDHISGKTAITVGEGTGLSEDLLETVRAVPGIAAAVPVITETARDVKTGAQLSVLGVDTLSDSKVRDYEVTKEDIQVADDIAFMNDPHGVLVTKEYASRTGLKAGDVLQLETTEGTSDFNVRGTLAARGPAKVFGGEMLLMDVYAAQIAFARGKRFDYIDVVPEEGVDSAVLETRIAKAIGNKAAIARPQRRTQEADQVLGSFKFGLTLASLMAIFVGAFIVYNALAIAVAQRRREIGILRALGVTRGQIMSVFVGEGLLLGAVGSVLGIGAGVGMARVVLKIVGSTVSELYVAVKPEALTVTGYQLVLGVSTGVGAAFVAALFPAMRASFIEPASAMRKKVDAADTGITSASGSLKSSGALMALSALVAVLARVYQSSTIGYSAAGLFALAGALMAPALAAALGRRARAWTSRRGPAVRMGVLGFERNSARNAVAIAALGMALASVVTDRCFLDSIKKNTSNWLDRTLRADVMVFAGRQVGAKFERPMSEAVLHDLEAIPGVEFVDGWRLVWQRVKGGSVQLVAYDLERYRKYNEIPVVAGELDPALREIASGKAVMVSETFAKQAKLSVGDKLSLQTAEGPRDFNIALVFIDYTSDLGIIATTRDVYKRLWKDTLVDCYSVYARKDVPVEPLRDQIARTVGDTHKLMVLGNGEYKKEMLAFIDRSFSLSRAMEIVSILVALLGIINTMVVAVIDRRMEIGILKAIGAARRQIQQMFVTEASLIGAAATVFGVGFGTILSLYTVKELLLFQLGRQIDFQFSTLALLETFTIAQIVAVVAAWAPTRSATKLDVVEALSYE